MDAKDLMIGNWVMFPHGIDKIVDLPYIEGKGLCASFAASATLFPVPIEQIKPIPLTPKILEKNGFIKRMSYSDGRWFLDNNDVVSLNIYSKSNKIWRMSIDTNRNENTVVYVTFVHELQNALRLCQIEKEIEL